MLKPGLLPCERPLRASCGESGGATLLFVAVLLMLAAGAAGVMLHFLLASRQIVASQLDREIAFRAAEAALLDAESELLAAARPGGQSDRFENWPPAGQCGRAAQAGLCRPAERTAPVWQAWLQPGGQPDAIGVPLGTFSGATLPALPPGAAGTATLPRYVAEPIGGGAGDSFRLRVTAIGFGRSIATRAIVQSEVQP